MSHVLIRPKAEKDLQEILKYYAEYAGAETVHRFRKAAEATFEDLIRWPYIGVLRRVHAREFRGVRMWRIRDFHDYLVFYFPGEEEVRIERVIHAARDYRRVLRSK